MLSKLSLPGVIVRVVSSFESHKINRRSLLIGGIAGAIGAKIGSVQTPHLETLTQWLNASRSKRKDALQQCLDRIREMDPSIHAWVQVSPEKPTGDGKLAGIPFGAKDIIETQVWRLNTVLQFTKDESARKMPP